MAKKLKPAQASPPPERRPWGYWDQNIGSNLRPAPEVPHEPPEGENLMKPGAGGIPRPGTKFAKPPKPPTPEQSAQITQAKTSRRNWARRKEGQERLRTAPEYFANRPESETGVPQPRQQMSVGMLYAWKGWTEQTGSGPSHWDRQLPGMADPNAAPRPPRWEELHPDTRAHVERELAERGTSVEQMGKDFGAQLDQAYLRAEQFRPEVRESQVLDAQHSGAAIPSYGMHPYGMDFYSTGEPRKVIDESAKELGIPQPVHAVMNSLTSPQTKFQQIHKTGEVSYPNNDVAMHAVRHAQAGGTYEDVSNQITGTEKRHQGFKTNLRKAVRATEQHMEGVSPSDWRGVPSKSNPEGSSLWENAPKTGPYANSFSDTHPQFVVGDVHTGGGGGVPHLSSDKPVLRDAEGNPRLNKEGREIRDKSEREKAIADVPFYHSAMDYAVRQEMIKRNLGSVRDTQGAEWGEEQLSRNLKSGPKEHQVYKRQDVFHQQAQQGKLF